MFKIIHTSFERVFYDGSCGLCHAAVRFALLRDRSGAAFRFAPLSGPTFAAAVPPDRRAGLPDSLVVLTREGRLLTRAAAIRHILSRLGVGWRLLGRVAGVVPAAILDRLYDAVARMRRRLVRAPAAACPVVPESLRGRFDD